MDFYCSWSFELLAHYLVGRRLFGRLLSIGRRFANSNIINTLTVLKGCVCCFHHNLQAYIEPYLGLLLCICYLVEEKTLALFDDFLCTYHIRDVSEVDADLIDQFLVSRPRRSPRSYNHLHCTVARLFSWLVVQGRLDHTPVLSRPKRATYQLKPYIFDAANACRLLDMARALPDKGKYRTNKRIVRSIYPDE